MYSFHGAQEIQVFSDKKIIKSKAVGSTSPEEVRWLAGVIVERTNAWKDIGWGYIVDISEMTPVTPEISEELVEMHKKLEEAGCKAMAFVDFGAFVISAQARNHQHKSKTGIKNGHFKSEEEATKWIEKIIN